MTPQECGVTVSCEIDEDGVPIVNVTTSRKVHLRLNGNSTVTADVSRSRQTFWNPDGSQGHSTVDLRGEER